MSMDDFVTCGFGSTAAQVVMVKRWIDEGQSFWVSNSIDGTEVYIHTKTNTGSDYGVGVPLDEAAFLADYATSRGHPDAVKLTAEWRKLAAKSETT
jgi:hypothetical protein